MTITPKFRGIAFAACIISIILLAVVGVYRTDALPHKNIFYDVIYVVSQLAYLFALYYLIELLKYAGEARGIVGFTIYAALIFIASIMGFATFPPTIMVNLVVTLNILIMLGTIYVIIVSFVVKNPLLSASFKVFAVVQIVMLALTIATLLLAYLSPILYFRLSRYMHFGGLIITAAIAYIVHESGKLLKKENIRAA